MPHSKFRIDGVRAAIHRLRYNQDGSAAASIGFAVFGTIIIASIVLSTVGVIRTNSFASSDNSLGRAIDARFDTYKAAYAASASAPSTTEICYSDKNACASITATVDADAALFVTVKAMWGGGNRSLSQVKTIAHQSAAYIVGYDSAGTPVWSAPTGVAARNAVSTLAGSASAGQQDGTGAAAAFRTPTAATVDSSGNVYIADTGNNRIRKISPTGVTTTLAGTGTSGFADGSAGAAMFASPSGIAVDSDGSVYVADTGNNRIRKVTSSGNVTTLTGSTSGFLDGSSTAALFASPTGIAITGGAAYVADTGNNRIRKVVLSSGETTTFAGNGTAGFTAGTGTAAKFSGPRGIAVTAAGTLYVTDTVTRKIRAIDANAVVSTLAGSGVAGTLDGPPGTARFDNPSSIAVGVDGTVYVADTANNTIRAIVADASSAGFGTVTTFAGQIGAGATNGAGLAAQFSAPTGLAADASGALYVADTTNNRIRKINW